jgi:ribosomal 50S subunit-associated protein YjgA (DUF615 family)
MDNETIIKTEHQQEVVQIFRKLIASGVLDSDKAITKILRDYPHYFHQPSADDIVKTSRSELNDEIRQRARAGVQSNKLADRIFNNVPPADKQKPA